jgi:hypothetical protein
MATRWSCFACVVPPLQQLMQAGAEAGVRPTDLIGDGSDCTTTSLIVAESSKESGQRGAVGTDSERNPRKTIQIGLF